MENASETDQKMLMAALRLYANNKDLERVFAGGESIELESIRSEIMVYKKEIYALLSQLDKKENYQQNLMNYLIL